MNFVKGLLSLGLLCSFAPAFAQENPEAIQLAIVSENSEGWYVQQGDSQDVAFLEKASVKVASKRHSRSQGTTIILLGGYGMIFEMRGSGSGYSGPPAWHSKNHKPIPPGYDPFDPLSDQSKAAWQAYEEQRKAQGLPPP